MSTVKYVLYPLVMGALLLAAVVIAGTPGNSIDAKSMTEPLLMRADSCDSQTPGDYNNDGNINLLDITSMISYFYQCGDAPAIPANGDPDGDCDMDCDDIYYLIAAIYEGGPAVVDCTCRNPTIDSCCSQYPGDFNSDGNINILDVTSYINYFYKCGTAPSPLSNGDADGDCDIDVDDMDYIIAFLYTSGPAPVDCTCRCPVIDSCSSQHPGDYNGDGNINLTDVTGYISYFYLGGTPPNPVANGDADGDCDVDADDLDYVIAYLYENGPAPVDCTCRCPALDSCSVQSPGDMNDDGNINLLDITSLISYVCQSGAPPSPLSNGDVNGDCVVDSLDIDYLIAYVYESGPAPVDCTCRLPVKGDCFSGAYDLDQRVAQVMSYGDPNASMPREFALHQNHPNPFNPSTTISYSLAEASEVKLVVYNITGQVVATLLDDYREAGEHSVVWDGNDESGRHVSSGIYFYTIRAGQFTDSRKMILMK